MSECAIALPASVNLPIPWLSQLNNQENPYGSCNVTSVAMCMQYLGYKPKAGVQLEDQLYRELLDKKWSRHDPYDLERLMKGHGVKVTFTKQGDWRKAKQWLANGNPLIAHGYFTRFGHIIVIRGYEEIDGKTTWFVNDPYGEYWANGYDNNVTGENLRYSHELMCRTCQPDPELWLHYIEK